MRRRSSQTNFAKVATAEIRRSSFNRSFGYKTTFDSGLLVPFFCQEVLPGDTHSVRPNIFARLATPIVPFMDNLRLSVFFFFVPNRLVWNNWQKFMGEQENPGDSIDYLIPTAFTEGISVGTISDYFGLPTDVPNISFSVLPHRAYWLIWNEWYRDENLQDSVVVCKDDSGYVWETDKDGFDTVNGFYSYSLARRGKRHDYFTSCLPWPQKGPGVEIPLTGDANVIARNDEATGNYIGISDPNGGSMMAIKHNGSDPYALYSDFPSSITNYAPLVADLSSVSGATINSLRQAFQIQKLLERDARGGTRYIEILLSHFGVRSPDQRLQRPEYLGGGSVPIVVNPVQQTSATSDSSSTPQGNLAATAHVVYSKHGFNHSFVEHGYIIGLMSVSADLTYQQGIHRMWSRQTRYDFYWPVLANLGEQAVLNKEIFAQGTAADDEVFGYQERWSEYRYQPSMITGKMRSTYAQSLDIWHLAQKFDSLPKLNSDFIQDRPPVERVVAVTDEPQFICDVWFDYNCVRPMPVRSTPGLIDHF